MSGIQNSKIDVIIPVYNEEEVIGWFYNRIIKVPLDMNLVFIDNNSSDGTVKKLRRFNGITLIEHKKNEGYGGSIIDGLRRTVGDRIVIIDADCEYPPEAIPRMVKELRDYEVVYGSRLANSRGTNLPAVRMIGNKLISVIFNVLFGQNTTDLYTGFKALRRSALAGITLNEKGFDHVLELAVKLSQKGIQIKEIPIEYTPRSVGLSKMKHLKETSIFLYRIMLYRLFG